MTDPGMINQEEPASRPFFQQTVALQTENILNRVILIISVLTSIGLLVTPVFYQRITGSILIILALLLTMVAAKVLLTRGHVRQASICAVSGVWLVFFLLIVLGGGLANANIIFFVSTTVWAGLLLGKRATIGVAGLGIAVGLGLALLAIFGYLPTPYFLSSPLANWAQLVFALVLTASTLNIAIRDRDNALDMANKQLAERLEAEKALQKSEERYKSLVENADEIIVVIQDGAIKFFNSKAVAMFGYSEQESASISVFELIHPEDREAAMERYRQKINGNTAATRHTYRIINKTGQVRWLENSSVLIEWEGLPATLNLITDITERKWAEEKIRQSEEKFHKVFMTSPHCMAITRIKDGLILDVNKGFEEITGWQGSTALGQTSAEIYFWPDPVERDFMINELQSGRDVLHREFQFRRKEGTLRTGIYSARSISIADEACLIFSMQDITDRKRLEERLYRAEKMEALGHLAGGVAHDLNNVLGVLSGYSELLLMKIPEGQRARIHAEKILQSTKKGAAIIQDLLTLARRGVTVAEVVSLNSIVKDFFQTPVFDKIREFHPQVKFRIECQEGLLNINGSPVHLEKTVMNLVSNAAEAIFGPGEVIVRTESRYLDEPVSNCDEVNPGDYTVLTVSDTGMGITAENREKIFEPFYTKKTMGRSGTGLGLAIVWGTVKDHNGYIDVQTEVGKGTTFTLYFPVTREGLGAPQQKIPLEQYTGRGESVLVVDDVAEQRDVASGLLRELGYRVQTVSSGEEAVEYLKNNKTDILVLDMIMAPAIDGLTTYQRVLEINPGQKAILVSGFSETDRVREAQRLGAGAYVKKPYMIEKIGLAIRNELRR